MQASQEHAREDMEIRALKEAQVEAAQLVDAIQAARAADGDLLTAEEGQQIDTAVAALAKAVQEADSKQLHEQTEALNRLSGEFAARRMDLHISKALRGESINKVESTPE